MAPIVRPAVELDAERLGAVHVLAWQAAYRDVMPDEYLNGPALYESAGWVAEGIERSAEVLGVVVPEVRYRTMLDPHTP